MNPTTRSPDIVQRWPNVDDIIKLICMAQDEDFTILEAIQIDEIGWVHLRRDPRCPSYLTMPHAALDLKVGEDPPSGYFGHIPVFVRDEVTLIEGKPVGRIRLNASTGAASKSFECHHAAMLPPR